MPQLTLRSLLFSLGFATIAGAVAVGVILLSSTGSSDPEEQVGVVASNSHGASKTPRTMTTASVKPSSSIGELPIASPEQVTNTPEQAAPTLSAFESAVTQAARPVVTVAPQPTLPPATLPPIETLPPVVPTPVPYTIASDTCIDGTFEGWEYGTLFELCNGELWIQTSFDIGIAISLRPDAQVVLYLGSYFLYVEGEDELVQVSRVTDYTRTCINGEYEGWEGDTAYELCNGEVWQQANYHYHYHYAYRPDVLIYSDGFQYMMKVYGDETIAVRRIY